MRVGTRHVKFGVLANQNNASHLRRMVRVQYVLPLHSILTTCTSISQPGCGVDLGLRVFAVESFCRYVNKVLLVHHKPPSLLDVKRVYNGYHTSPIHHIDIHPPLRRAPSNEDTSLPQWHFPGTSYNNYTCRSFSSHHNNVSCVRNLSSVVCCTWPSSTTNSGKPSTNTIGAAVYPIYKVGQNIRYVMEHTLRHSAAYLSDTEQVLSTLWISLVNMSWCSIHTRQ